MSNIGESQVWSGRIFSHGWKTAAGGTQAVVEPATGESIGSAEVMKPALSDAACAIGPASVATSSAPRSAAVSRRARTGAPRLRIRFLLIHVDAV